MSIYPKTKAISVSFKTKGPNQKHRIWTQISTTTAYHFYGFRGRYLILRQTHLHVDIDSMYINE